MTTKTSTARDILDKITGKRTALANAEREIADLEKAARWAEGAERRARLEAVAAQAIALADNATDTTEAITDALVNVTSAVRKVHELAAGHNDAVAGIGRQLAAEGVGTHNGDVSPSPANAGIAPTADGVVVADQRIRTIVASDIVPLAVAAGQHHDAAPPIATPLVEHTAPLIGPFWRLPNGATMAASGSPGSGCVEITKVEYLAATWGIEVRDLPAEVLDTLTDAERAQLAPLLLPAGRDPDLLPTDQ